MACDSSNTYNLPVNRRGRFLMRAGLIVGGGLAGASSSAGVEEYRLHANIATSGHEVGRYRPAGLASTTITYRAPTNAPVVALTFDDGPSDRYTDRLLNILDGLDIPATFFLIGEHVNAISLARSARGRTPLSCRAGLDFPGTPERRCSHSLTPRSSDTTSGGGTGQRKDDAICASTSA